MQPIKIVVIAADSQIRAALAAAVDDAQVSVTESISPASDPMAVLARAGADAVVLYHENEDAIYTLAERIYISRLALAVVMVCKSPDAGVFARAMECGAARTLEYQAEKTPLTQTVMALIQREKSRESASAPSGAFASKVVCGFGTKGGVGKTMFCVNLAVALAAQGKKVALVDLDLQFGDVGIFLDVLKSDSFADVVEENAFEFAALKSYLFAHKSGVDVLCAPSSPEYAEVVLADHVGKLIAALKPNYDYVVVDMPPAFNDTALAALEAATTVYFIVNPDISTLRNAKVSIAVMESLNLGDKVQVVLNKNGASSIKQKDIEKILERTTVLAIPSDTRCAVKAVNRGVPVVTGDKRNAIAAAVNGFAVSLCGETEHKKHRFKKR